MSEAHENLALVERMLNAAEVHDARVRAFCGALRAVIEAHMRQDNAALDLSALDAFAGETSFHISFIPAALIPRGDCAAKTIGALLAAVYRAVENKTFRRLKICGAPSCRLVFVDRSKNTSARWCSMAVCGNRNKARARRARQARLDEP